MKKKVAIIGCGIAGLTAANLFKIYSNFHVKVYEKEKTLSLEEGYGIQLAQNSISIFPTKTRRDKKIFKLMNQFHEIFHIKKMDFI